MQDVSSATRGALRSRAEAQRAKGTLVYRSTRGTERWNDGEKDGEKDGMIYRMRRGVVGVKSCRVGPPGSGG